MELILVDKFDNQIGISEKHRAHINGGTLHRSFSVLLFNEKHEVLLQQRAKSKYHTPELWSNSCCSHPMPGESVDVAVQRRLKEELGVSCDCEELFSFIYKAEVGNNMIEHEYNHVYFGMSSADKKISFNKDEASAVRWVALDTLIRDIGTNPNIYTPWFKVIINEHYHRIQIWLQRR